MRNLMITILILQSVLTIQGIMAREAKITEFSVNIKVVFVGIPKEWLDTDYLKSLLVNYRVVEVLIDGRDLGFNITLFYDFTFTTEDFKKDLLHYLSSIEQVVTRKNPWFSYLAVTKGGTRIEYRETINYLYDAEELENWFLSRKKDIGGLSNEHYTIVILYLPELPSIGFKELKAFLQSPAKEPPRIVVHYYKVERRDKDLGYRPLYLDFLLGWGGKHRFWFIDLSAGPSFIAPHDLPLQIALEDQKIDPRSPQGNQWMAEYVAHYINEFVFNLASPSYLYKPRSYRGYYIVINVFDCRTIEERAEVPIESTISPSLIESSLSRLIPGCKVRVRVFFRNIEDYPHLMSVLEKNKSPMRSWLNVLYIYGGYNFTYIDAIPIYFYLRESLTEFITEDISKWEKVIPVFAFAFSNEYFAFRIKWAILKTDPETGAFWGAAFEELILIGMNQRDFLRGEYVRPPQKGKGLGFTQVIIHEIGHVLGLAHPHTYGNMGSFVASPMSYYALEYNFSIFDQDALLRAIACELIVKSVRTLRELEVKAKNKYNASEVLDKVKKLRDEISFSKVLCNRLNYYEALLRIKNIVGKMEELHAILEALPTTEKVLREQILEARKRVAELEESLLYLKANLTEAKSTIAKLGNELRLREIYIRKLERNIVRLEEEVKILRIMVITFSIVLILCLVIRLLRSRFRKG